MGSDTIIEFNGKRYDAITGELLGNSTTIVAEPLARAPRRTIDGVMHHATKLPRPQPASQLPHHPPKNHPVRKPATSLVPHHPQSAKTLMRRAVRKPATNLKPAIKTQSPAEIMATPVTAIAAKRSVNKIDPARRHRAKTIPRSHAVQKFTLQPPRPQPHTPTPQIFQPTTTAARPATHRAAPQPAHDVAAQNNLMQHRAKPDIFEAAIARANSHEQAPPAHRKHHRKHRTASILAGVAAVLIMSGFLAYLNMPNIELKIASMHAGFSASMPSYSPTGYELADIENRRGTITLSFRSGDRSYHLTQQPSNWTSQTLQDDIIASAGSKAIESKGRTIYIYDGSASWLSGGVRYDLTGNAPLDEQEIADIAAST